MDKIKLANGIMYISMALLFIFTAALSLSKGFTSENNLFLIVGGICIVGIFYFGYKGMTSILDAFFKK
ncbi:MAG: hypothetical protein CMP75_00445 [Flavobacteriales bacterium]|nr:hypothetical protein [Flavobacteriales bacterium]|tara:strand:- start:3699 stop:3902 length:204 start_codon:yes stop_codon:yes gene_type:complete